MGRSRYFTPEEQREIKAELWGGMANSQIATKYAVSRPTVSNIRHGTLWAHVPWPDGTTGEMPQHLQQTQSTNKRFATAVTKRYGGYDPDAEIKSILPPENYGFLMERVRADGFTYYADWIRDFQIREANEKHKITHPNTGPNPNYDPDAPKKPRPGTEPIDPETAIIMPWDDITKDYSDLKLVKKVAEDDRLTRDAIGLIFAATGDDFRRGDQAALAIEQVKRQLRGASRYEATSEAGAIAA